MVPQNSLITNFLQIYIPLCSAKQTFIQVWNYLRMSKLQNFHVWENYLFNLTEEFWGFFLQVSKVDDRQPYFRIALIQAMVKA